MSNGETCLFGSCRSSGGDDDDGDTGSGGGDPNPPRLVTYTDTEWGWTLTWDDNRWSRGAGALYFDLYHRKYWDNVQGALQLFFYDPGQPREDTLEEWVQSRAQDKTSLSSTISIADDPLGLVESGYPTAAAAFQSPRGYELFTVMEVKLDQGTAYLEIQLFSGEGEDITYWDIVQTDAKAVMATLTFPWDQPAKTPVSGTQPGENVPTPTPASGPTCGGSGADCRRGYECCSGLDCQIAYQSDQGVCANCKELEEYCTSDSDCCSLQCYQGACAHGPQI